jgi:NAD-dependent DNA ligase
MWPLHQPGDLDVKRLIVCELHYERSSVVLSPSRNNGAVGSPVAINSHNLYSIPTTSDQREEMERGEVEVVIGEHSRKVMATIGYSRRYHQ